jgi:nucleoside-diphosphate-sugar epimerase
MGRMRVLVIGGTGLISTAITRQLLERGDDVTLYNRGSTPARLPEDYQVISGDRKDAAAFEQQMWHAGEWDCVIDMICFTPEEAESDRRAFTGRTRQLIFCSTVDVYSRPASRYPIREDESRRSNTAYGRNKAASEDVLLGAHSFGELNVTVIRPAQTYGEGGVIIHSMGWGTSYLDRIAKGLPIIQHGDGTGLWSSLHVDDCARAFMKAIGNEKAFGRAYNVTGEQWQTWLHYNQGVAEALGVPEPRLVFIPSTILERLAPKRAAITRENFQYTNIFDTSAARADLGFSQTIPWVDGARRTIEWLRENDRIVDAANDPEYDAVLARWEDLTSAIGSA